jgi:SAM-dependent methyltransferase
MNSYAPKKYWAGVAEASHPSDARGLAPVLHPNAPSWFNLLIDDLQSRAVDRALDLANVHRGAKVLDVGCGTGRWIRRYKQMGLIATGVDATMGMLQLARHQDAVDVSAGELSHLPFPGSQFDFVSDITVVQHIPFALQGQSLAEMLRVLRPGGCLILMELIRGKGAHIFPRNPQDWVQQVTQNGAKLVGWFGQEFLPFDRLFVHLVQIVAGRDRSRAGGNTFSAELSPGTSLAQRFYWNSRHVVSLLSAWTDPFAEKVLPARFVTHGVFVFRK